MSFEPDAAKSPLSSWARSESRGSGGWPGAVSSIVSWQGSLSRSVRPSEGEYPCAACDDGRGLPERFGDDKTETLSN